MRLTIALSFILICVFQSSFTQNNSQIDTNMFINSTYKNGLSNNEVNCFAQDSAGFIWIGTNNGLNRYDGYTYKTYFNNATDKNSISDNTITSLIVDSNNNLWIGTKNNSVCRYNLLEDNFTHYPSKAFTDSLLSHHYITDMTIDSYGQLWVATTEGINLYHEKEDYFEPINFGITYSINDVDIERLTHQLHSNYALQAVNCIRKKVFHSKKEFTQKLSIHTETAINPKELSIITSYAFKGIPSENNKYDRFSAITSDSIGNLWLAYQEAGFARYNIQSGTVEKHTIFPEFSDAESANHIRSLLVDGDNLWIATTNDGIYTYSISNQKISKVYNEDKYGTLSLCKLNNQIYFYAGGNLYCYPSNFDTLKNFKVSKTKMSHITYNINEIFGDKHGNLWIGSQGDGISLMHANNSFSIWDNSDDSPIQLSQKAITSLHALDNTLYIGYYNNNIDKIDLSNNTLITIRKNEDFIKKQAPGSVLALNTDKKNNLWLGSYFQGLQKYNTKTNVFTFFNSDYSKDIRSIVFDRNNNIWAATHGYGLAKFNIDGQFIKRFEVNYDNWMNNLPDNWLNEIIVDKEYQLLWIGTSQGLCQYNLVSKEFSSFRFVEQDSTSIIHNSVITVYCDNQNWIWVGTPKGLNLFLRESNQFIRFPEVKELANTFINSIIEDQHGNLWLGTNNGILHLIIDRGSCPSISKINNYGFHSGVKGQYYPRAVTKDKNGVIYFGGKYGINSFHPDSISTDITISRVLISDIKVLNKSIFDNKSPIHNLGKSFYKTNSVILEYNQNILSIDFSTLNYLLNSKIQYYTLLEGFNNKWQRMGSDHKATYTNLKPGKYRFKVKAVSLNGESSIYNPSFGIEVRPPFWRSNLGLIILAIIGISILFLSFYILIAWLKMQKRIELRQLEAKNLKALDESKTRFFTNITHEFRTPITLILGPLTKILKDTGKKLSRDEITNLLKLVDRNASILLRLVNQIMDFKRADAGKLTFNTTSSDIIPFLHQIIETFIPIADEHNINFNYSYQEENIVMIFDADKMERIIYNLLSNAFKYTPDGKTIDLKILVKQDNVNTSDSKFLRIIIEDTGIGIPKNEISKLFTLFHQANNAFSVAQTGTGVGLYLVKKYTELHSGKVYCNSELGKGSIFTVELPIITHSEMHFSPNKFPNKGNIPFVLPNNTKKIKILIVEDNVDILFFLKNEMQENFEILTSNNGFEALKLLKKEIPDFILTDIMMPKMDGYEFCKHVKTDISLSHIPLFILSAKNSVESQLLGYDSGADDYLTKPIELEVLIAKIHRMMQLKQQIQKQIVEHPDVIPTAIKQKNSADKTFLEKLHKIIENHLDNPDLNVELLAKKMFISRSVLYEKIKILTGQPVADYIKTYRLNSAAQIIKKGEPVISEIVWQVGFKSHAHFTRAFKQRYNCTPTEYAAKF